MNTGDAGAGQDERTELRRHVDHIAVAAAEIPELSDEERTQLVGRIRDFVTGTLLSHVPVSSAHAIRARADQLDPADVGDTARVQDILSGLHVLAGAALDQGQPTPPTKAT